MKRIILYYILAVTLLLVAVYLFTRPAFFTAYDLSQKGTLGDAINGLTAPAIGLMTAGLLYYSFKEQLKANRLLQAQWQFDNFVSMYKDMQNTFSSCFVEYFAGDGNAKAYGKNAIKIFLRDPGLVSSRSREEFLIDLETFLYELNILIERSKQLQHESFYLKSKLVRFYRYNLGPNFELMTRDLERSEPRLVSHFIRTSKMVQENMRTIHYMEFSSEGQTGFDNAAGLSSSGQED